MRAALPCVFLASLALAGPLPTRAQAGVYRCLGPQGQPIYSDQPCEYQGATARGDPGARAAEGTDTGFTPVDCARKPEALVEGVRAALETRDVNRLASYYHWAGTSAGGARFLMDELERVVGRPVQALEWLTPAAEPAPDPVFADLAAPAVEPPPEGPPTGLRVHQASGPADAGSVVVDFRLRRHAGCWWIEF
jgi:hypothetical protein